MTPKTKFNPLPLFKGQMKVPENDFIGVSLEQLL